MSTTPTERLNAALSGRYAIERELGEGGMATVYLAQDLKHERQVALKVLKPELAAVVGAERFLAEIKTTANLQHPHILPLHDSGEADGFLFYVMPYVEGETLADRIERDKQLPVDVAVRIATDIAEALHAAHEQGVIHRDIKPANILLSRDRPLVADFGIALAVSAAGGGRMTETGLSMGTPFYMSPEQASADREPNASSDVYSLGCVLYEMLVGDPPHVGSSAQAVLVKVLTDEAPAPTKARPSIPANVDAAIRKSLEKLPADRFASAQAFARALADSGFRHGEVAAAASAATPGPWKQLTLAASTVAILAIAIAGWAVLKPTPPGPVASFASPFLPGQGPVPERRVAISRDGTFLAYVGPGESPGSPDRVWVRRFRDLEASPVLGTEGTFFVTISPDGTELAYSGITTGGTRVIGVAGGPTRPLMEHGREPLWGPDGHVYASSPAVGVFRIPESGGEPEQLLQREPDQGFLFVGDVLPGGHSVLFRIGSLAASEIHLLDLESGESRPVAIGRNARYLDPGYLVVHTDDGALSAARFDPQAGEFRSELVPVLDDVADFSISQNGTLVYRQQSSGGALEFVWVDQDGVAQSAAPNMPMDQGLSDRGFDLSPDGSRIVLTHDGRETGSQDLWVLSLPNGPLQRVTAEEDNQWGPRWVGSGDSITYTSGETGGRATLKGRADLMGVPDTLFDGSQDAPNAQVGPDGAWLVLRVGTIGGLGRHISTVRLDSDASVPEMIVGGDYSAVQPALSPDGQLLAYSSNESGRFEVYVRPFPDVNTDGVQVSTDGGSQPVWSHGGRELFFVSGSNDMMVAELESTPRLRIDDRERLFPISSAYFGFPNTTSTNYDVTADDQRFLMVRSVPDDANSQPSLGPIVVQNWIEEVKQLVGG